MNTLPSENLDRIRKLLSLNPDGLCINEIAKVLNRHRNSVSRDLHALLVSGQVQAHAFGTTRIFTLVQRDQTFPSLMPFTTGSSYWTVKGTSLIQTHPSSSSWERDAKVSSAAMCVNSP